MSHGPQANTSHGKSGSEGATQTQRTKTPRGKVLPRKSTRGTKPTVANNNLCAIIEACAKGGVVKLKFDNIEIDFSPQHTLPVEAMPPVTVSPLVYGAQKDIGQNTLERPMPFDRDLLDDLRTSQMMIDDPHGFEREQIIAQLRSGVGETVQN